MDLQLMLFPLEGAVTRPDFTSTCIKGQEVLILGLPQDLAFFPVDAFASSNMLEEKDAVAVLRYNRTIMFDFFYKISFYEIDSYI